MNYLEGILITLSGKIWLPFFAALASFIEEVIPPIPSPSMSILVGTLSFVQEYSWAGIVLLAVLGALGKTLGSIIVYYVFDKLEDFFSGKVSKFIGLSHEQIESFGRYLSQSWKDYFILTFLRALPIIPSTIVSVGSGLLKINMIMFIVSTFVGSIIRGLIFIYLGFTSVDLAYSLAAKAVSAESIIEILVAIVVVVILFYLYRRRRQSKIS